ncbi:O-antigen ligase family protein [bacterium]|nr:O-antigen ligase family protein [bacterium]
MNKYIIFASSWLMYLLPLALLTGPFLPDIIICLIGISVTFLIIKEKKYTYIKNKYSTFFLLFCLYLIISSFFAESIIISLESSLFYFRFGLFAICVWYLIDNNKKFIKNFSIFLLVTFAFALLDGYYQYYNDIGIFGFEYPGVRLSLLLDDRAILGGYLSRLFPLLLAVLIYSYDLKKSNILLIMLILILTDILIFISGERTALGLLFLSTVFIIVFLSKYKKIRFFTFLISLVLMTLIMLLNPSIKERNIDQTINEITGGKQLTAGGYKDILLFSKIHQSYIVSGWKMFVDKPLLGQGPKMWRVLCDDTRFNQIENKYKCSTHPHNSYAQLLAETGILGLVFIIILYFKLLKLIFVHCLLLIRKQEYLLSDFQICLIACFMVTLWPFIPSQNFFNNWINIIYYLPIGFFLHSLHKKEMT